MPVQVRFHSVSSEEYEKLRKSLESGVDGVEERLRREEFEGGIFFIEDDKEVEGDGSTK